MPAILHIDFESRSDVDLKEAGLGPYCRGHYTHIHCMAYAFDDEATQIWIHGEPFPAHVAQHVAQGGKVIGHNVVFEIEMWNHTLRRYRQELPLLTIEQCECTMAMALAMALPASLDLLGQALRLDQRKDAVGRRVMMQLAKMAKSSGLSEEPQFYTPEKYPEKFATLYEYCKQDVIVEREAHKHLLPLTPEERKLWEIDYRINTRGVMIDPTLVLRAEAIGDIEQARLDEQMLLLTKGQVKTTRVPGQIAKFIAAQGVHHNTMSKKDLPLLLKGDIPASVRDVVALRLEGAKASTAKYRRAAACLCDDARVRHLFQYHGASTGRWAGRLIQPQNLPRSEAKFEQVLRYIAAIHTLHVPQAHAYLHLKYGKVLHVLADCLRAMFVPETGKVFMAADYSNIESRVLAWLAGEQWLVNAYRDLDAGTGHDIYKLMYSRAFGVPVDEVTEEQRQAGKQMILAFGYGGGAKAIQAMAMNYGLQVGPDMALELRDAFRATNQHIKAYWYKLQDAGEDAINNPGKTYTVGHIALRMAGPHMWCRLPSGRVLCYPHACITKDTLGYDTMAVHSVNIAHKFAQTHIWGGTLCENITQAIARDILSDAIIRLEEADWPVVLHVHDEVVVEVDPTHSVDAFLALINTLPAWAQGLPLTSKAWTGNRYRK